MKTLTRGDWLIPAGLIFISRDRYRPYRRGYTIGGKCRNSRQCPRSSPCRCR